MRSLHQFIVIQLEFPLHFEFFAALGFFFCFLPLFFYFFPFISIVDYLHMSPLALVNDVHVRRSGVDFRFACKLLSSTGITNVTL